MEITKKIRKEGGHGSEQQQVSKHKTTVNINTQKTNENIEYEVDGQKCNFSYWTFFNLD